LQQGSFQIRLISGMKCFIFGIFSFKNKRTKKLCPPAFLLFICLFYINKMLATIVQIPTMIPAKPNLPWIRANFCSNCSPFFLASSFLDRRNEHYVNQRRLSNASLSSAQAISIYFDFISVKSQGANYIRYARN